MCNHCLAHREFLEALDDLVLKTKQKIKALDDKQKGYHAYLELVEEIPGGLPDGTGIFTDIGWVRWAKKQLGYDDLSA